MAIVGAITPGIHLPDLARALRAVHADYLEGRPPGHRPRDIVARSWGRVTALGVSPDGAPRQDPMGHAEVEQRRADSGLAGIVGELSRLIGDGTDRAHMLLVVTDADGVVLWREGSAQVRQRADSFGFMEGATWTEERVGTNAIGTALAEAAPVQLFSAEHFERAQHPWYCTATPIHDPVSGRLMGVIDVSGPAFTLHPAIQALVEATRRLAEARLQAFHEASLNALRRSTEPLLAGLSGAAVVIDDDGWVATSRGVAVGRRLPAPMHQTPMTVPGLGACIAERLARGWLIRQKGNEPDAVALRLRMSDSPVLEVLGGAESWCTSLPMRHAGILSLLASVGARGMSAAQLSTALYGDADHIVTVRAEVSRLRRTLGSIIASNPYRLHPRVTIQIDH